MKTFESIFTTDNAKKAAQTILKSIDDTDTQVDYDFFFQQGEFVSNDINTWIKFDTDKYPLLNEMLKILTDDEIEPTEERIDLFSKFREEVCELLAGEFKKDISNKLRNCVFGGKIDEKMCPINEVKVVSFDISDVPDSAKYLLVVKKEQPRYEISQSVSKDLYDYLHTLEEESTSKEEIELKINQFVSEKKDSDSKFKYIKRVTLKRAFFECQVELFADYTMVKPEDVYDKIENIPDF